MPQLTGYTASLPTDVLLGVGILAVRPPTMANGYTPFGVTDGGLEFDPAREVRNIPFDGKFYDVEGLDWEIGGAAIFTGTFKQFGANQIGKFETGLTATTPGAGIVTTLYTPQPAGEAYAAGDYITNLCWIVARPTSGYIQIRFPKAFCTQYKLVGRHKEELTIQATFAARQPSTDALSNLGIRPFLIEELSALS